MNDLNYADPVSNGRGAGTGLPTPPAAPVERGPEPARPHMFLVLLMAVLLLIQCFVPKVRV
jgi:hypothetical protein